MANLRRLLPYLPLVAALLVPWPAASEPKAPTEEESADVTFAKSFVGKTYEDELDIEGWTDLGGGLVFPPIYVHQYEREEDGTHLVLTSREAVQAVGGGPSSFVVADALVVPKSQKDLVFSIACVQGDDETLRFMAEVKGNEEKEWWTDVRRAWEISLETGQIASVKPKGVRCTNPDF